MISCSGIGNTILSTPLLDALQKIRPNAKFDLLTSRKIFQAPLCHGSRIANFYDLEKGAIRTIIQLRRNKYTYSFNCFPSNRWQFNVISFLAGAKVRISHRYPVGNKCSFLLNAFVDVDSNLHDIEQNIALLKYFGSTDHECLLAKPFFELNQEDRIDACEWLEDNGCRDMKLIGVHLGGGSNQFGLKDIFMNRPIGKVKVPVLNSVIADLKAKISNYNYKILLFGYGDEVELVNKFYLQLPKHLQKKTLKVKSDLWTVAAIIEQCNFFVSGDTGLMHIAACYNIPQKAYFNATNPSRTAPRNMHAELVVASLCSSYKYPFS